MMTMAHRGDFIDMAGWRFVRWTVLRHSGYTHRGSARWLCRCDCGAERELQGDQLRRGRSQSCGCLTRELMAERATHEHARRGNKTRTYRSWHMMLQRCGNPKHTSWEHYGGRGIAVCERWRVFANFLADMGERPPGLTLERVDNDGGYEPDNCIWADHFTQMQNTRRSRRRAATQ